MKNKILIIDIETSNFLNANGTILEIGLVELDITTGATKILFDSCVHEKGITREEIANSWIIANSDMTVLEIQYSPDLEKVRDKVQKILNRYELGATAYNNRFDFDFMESRKFSFPKKLACPMLLLTPILQLPAKNGRGTKWPNVGEAMKYYLGVENYVEKHRGCSDALDEAKIVYKLIKDGYFPM